MDLGRENGLQGVPCLCTRRRIQWKCLLRSFSPAQVNLDCQTTHNIWRLLIARVTLRIRQPQVVLYFYSIVQYIFAKTACWKSNPAATIKDENPCWTQLDRLCILSHWPCSKAQKPAVTDRRRRPLIRWYLALPDHGKVEPTLAYRENQ